MPNNHGNYKETKNVIHNDIGVTKEEILDVFRQVAQDEITKLVSDNQQFIYETLKSVIKDEMIDAIQDHRYPQINGHMTYFRGSNGRGIDSFKDYVAGTMKAELIKEMKEQFSINLDIDKKE